MSQTTSSTNQQQTIMPTPPAIITTKDLYYLKDAMSWELLAMKKCAHFANEVQDPNFKEKINQVGQMHQRHFQMLLAHCQNNNAAAMIQNNLH